MVISHKYKYIFIQLDKTASTAIAEELVNHYEGEYILWKHARYCDFLAQANIQGKGYLSFSGIRNPLDVVVSDYFRHKYDQCGRFRRGIGNYGVTPLNYRKYKYIKENNGSFKEFLEKFYLKSIYWEWKTKDFEKLHFIYRYENLQKDFSEILKRLNINQKRKLSIINKTEGKNSKYISYYTPEIIDKVIQVFSPYMQRWNYYFPDDWIFYRKDNSIKEFLILDLVFKTKKCLHKFIDQPFIYQRVYGKYI